MQIQNPTPIETTATFDKLWVAHLRVVLSGEAQYLHAHLLPYNGSHVLQAQPRLVRIVDLAAKRPQDAQLDAVLSALEAEAKRHAGTAEVRSVSVQAGSPERPVVVVIEKGEGQEPYLIRDCFALAATDTQFATVLNGTLAEIARLASTTVV